MNIGTTNNINKFKSNLTKLDQKFINYIEDKGLILDEKIDPDEIGLYVIESEYSQFITNDLILFERMTSKFNISGYKTTLSKVNFKDFDNSIFVDDDKFDRYWLSGMVNPSLSLVITDQPNKLNQFIPVFQQRHFEEFKSIYDNQLSLFKELPLMKINLAVGDKEVYKEFKTKDAVNNCPEEMKTSINNLISAQKTLTGEQNEIRK